MHTVWKVVISLGVILVCTAIGKKAPSLAGLIAVMPLTGSLVLVWLYVDSGGNGTVMKDYCRAALWGIVPSILFFLAAFCCFKREVGLAVMLGVSFGVWVAGALVHQWLIR